MNTCTYRYPDTGQQCGRFSTRKTERCPEHQECPDCGHVIKGEGLAHEHCRVRCVECGELRQRKQVRPANRAADGWDGVCTTCQPSTESLRSLLP